MKRAVAVLVLGLPMLWCSSARACSGLRLLAYAAPVADMATTALALSQGAVETDPLLGSHPHVGILLADVAAQWVFTAMVSQFGCNRITRAIFIAQTSIGFAMAANNLVVATHHDDPWQSLAMYSTGAIFAWISWKF